MAFGGLFGGGAHKHPNLDHIVQALHDQLGLQLAAPPEDVLAVIDQMTHRELLQYDNAHSVEGMQELFRVRSIRAVVDPANLLVSLFIASAEALEEDLKAEHAQQRVLHVADHRATQRIIKPLQSSDSLAGATAAAKPAEPVAPLPPGFEHLEAMEQLRAQIADMFVKHGKLHLADKDVLKEIRPTDSSLEKRVAALERWQTEMARRVRGLMAPKATQHLVLGAEDMAVVKPEENLRHRFDALVTWVGKLIKAFEHTGVKFHNKPMWLPH